MAGPRHVLKLVRIVAGFLLIWVVLDQSAGMLGSTRGAFGIVVCALVTGAAVGVEWLLFGLPPSRALPALGFRRATGRSLIATVAVALGLLAYFPVYAVLVDVPLTLRPDWNWLVPGLFAQAGIAEETLFRGYLFRHIREGRAFWPAALLAALPFVAVHLLLFATLDIAIAAASLALSVSMSLPLAWLFERGGDSVWPPAILHFVIQGAIKLVDAPEGAMAGLAVGWIAVAAVLPWLLFGLLPRPAASPIGSR